MHKELLYGAGQGPARSDAAMEKFRDNRFGQFIHWGLYSVAAGHWNGKEYEFAGEFLPRIAKIPTPEWESLAQQFSIENFDPEAWAETAATLGAKYMTITTKHHDGFCLWPSEQTPFNIANSPAERDVLAELIAAYEARGIDVNLYYSVLDWHHPDWRFSIENDDDEAAFQRYLAFAMAQLEELATRYPSVKAFWFDGTWDESVKANGKWTWEVENRLKELIPGVIVNSRLRADDFGARHFDSNGLVMGDYESGYERRLPLPWDDVAASRDWEACMTISQASWGYHRGEWALKTLKHPLDIVDMVVHCTSLNGNFLLNFGPRGDGSLQEIEMDIAAQVGSALGRISEAVYGCGPATGWNYPGWGYFTKNPETGIVYAVVTRVPLSGRIKIELPAGLQIAAHRAVDGSDYSLADIAESLVEITLPSALKGPIAFALRVESKDEVEAFREPNPDVLV